MEKYRGYRVTFFPPQQPHERICCSENAALPMKTNFILFSLASAEEHGFISQHMKFQILQFLKKVIHFSVVLTVENSNLEKYAAFPEVLCRTYMKHKSPVKMMDSNISVLRKGYVRVEKNGCFLSKDFGAGKTYFASSSKDVISQFEMETVMLHTATALKQKDESSLITPKQKLCQDPAPLVWHQQGWNISISYVHLNSDEPEALWMCICYIAGCVDLEEAIHWNFMTCL